MRSNLPAFVLPIARVAMVGLGALVTAGVLSVFGQPSGIEAVSTLSVLYLLPVNVVCLVLVGRAARRAGSSLRAYIGFDRSRVGRDIAWGLLWLVVLYLPFVLAIAGTMVALFGADAFDRFELVFAPDPARIPEFGRAFAVVFGVIAVVTFAPLNAPIEELVYRAHPIRSSRSRLLAVLAPSAAFAAQHVFFAPTAQGMLVYAVAFFVWGVGSSLIYLRQRRLMPLIVAHVIVNLFSSAPALILPFVL